MIGLILGCIIGWFAHDYFSRDPQEREVINKEIQNLCSKRKRFNKKK